MGNLYDMLREDYRVKEGLKTCINCGTCTAICPAAEFYRYDPRKIVDTVQRGDDDEIEKLLKAIRSGIAESACHVSRDVLERTDRDWS